MISQPASIVRGLVLVAIIVSASAACSSNKAARDDSLTRSGTVIDVADRHRTVRDPALRVGEVAAEVALSQVGVPYRYGGSSPSGFDCSGLVHYSYASAGKPVPRTTAGLWAQLAPVAARHMRAGDLLFFNIDGKMSHVGMYVGDGRFVHAPSSGRTVSVESLESDFYRAALIRAGRPK